MAHTSKNSYKIKAYEDTPHCSRISRRLAGSSAKRTIKGRPINKLQSNLALCFCGILLASSASADLQFESVSVLDADSVKKFDGLRQHGVSLSFGLQGKSGRSWMPDTLDFTGGWLERGPDTAAFISIGPTYRFGLSRMDSGRIFVDFGAHPTYVSHTHFNGKPLGGKFFFTSYLGLGAFMDRQRRFSAMIRYQHTSNAGLEHDNPGVDMLGLTFSYHFGRNKQLFSAANPDQ